MEIIERLKSETPSFWKRLQYVSASLASIALGILAIPTTSGIALPVIVSQIANYVLVVGITAGGVSQLAVTPEKAKELNKE